MNLPGRYRARTVGELTGIGRRLLLAWEKRHALLRPERARGGGRLYTEEDLQVLLRVQELLGSGLTIGEIAAGGRSALLDRRRTEAPPRVETRGLDDARARIVKAAGELDADAIAQALDDAFVAVSAEAALEWVVAPAAVEIGALWEAGRIGVASEHLASSLFRERALRALEAARRRASGPLVVMACLPGEQHELGLLLVALRAARAGFRVVYLGPSLPLEDLDRVCERLAPDVVALSACLDDVLLAHSARLEKLIRARDAVRFVIGGQAAPRRRARLERAGAQVWDGTVALESLFAARATGAKAAKKRRARR